MPRGSEGGKAEAVGLHPRFDMVVKGGQVMAFCSRIGEVIQANNVPPVEDCLRREVSNAQMCRVRPTIPRRL